LVVDQDPIEKRPTVGQNSPSNFPADVWGESIPNDVDLLLVHHLPDIHQTMVIVAFLAKECAEQSAKGVYAQF
jgi:hypothetical protein